MNNGQEEQYSAQSFTKMWADFASRMAQAGMAFSPGDAPPDAARAMRDAALGAMGEYCEKLMRSPEFLETLKQSMAASIEMRKQLNEFLGRMHHEMQAPSRQDVDQLMLALGHLEHRIVDRLERLEDRLGGLESRLRRDKPAQTREAAKPASKTKPSAKRPAKSPAAGRKKALRK